MEIQTKFYGPVAYEEEDIVRFPGGLPGFEEFSAFLVLQPEGGVFGCLQSVEDPGLAFVTVSPYAVCPDYSIHLPAEDVQALQLNGPEEAELSAIVSVRPKLDESTVNLQAPLVINKKHRIGRQVLLPESGYPIRFPLFVKDAAERFRVSAGS